MIIGLLQLSPNTYINEHIPRERVLRSSKSISE